MKKYILTLLITAWALSAFAWGQKGHDVTAYIAEQHLTSTTRAIIDSLFEGKSIVYWSNWLDNASHTRDYAYTKTWHYKNIDEGDTYESAPANPAGDVVLAIKQQIEILSDPTTSSEQAQLALKILVHTMGDLHQPMHMGHATDLGGNRFKLKFFNSDTNLHSIWDGNLVESAHKWSYTEWQDQIDRATIEQQISIINGKVDDWAKETFAIASEVYTYFKPDQKVMYDEIAYWAPVIETQFLRGGLRLAHVLNTIFDPQYNK